jgi:hypothetical protein
MSEPKVETPVQVSMRCHNFVSHPVLNRQVTFIQSPTKLKGFDHLHQLKGEYVQLELTTTVHGRDETYPARTAGVVTHVEYEPRDETCILELTAVHHA